MQYVGLYATVICLEFICLVTRNSTVAIINVTYFIILYAVELNYSSDSF